MNPPATIAHYRINSNLGGGAIGAFDRATDTKLNRKVAIKVLRAGSFRDNVTLDGPRFPFITAANSQPQESSHITVVTNWTAGVRNR